MTRYKELENITYIVDVLVELHGKVANEYDGNLETATTFSKELKDSLQHRLDKLMPKKQGYNAEDCE